MELERAKLTFVETLDEVNECISWLGSRRPVLGIDSETRGLEYWKYPGTFTRLVQIGDANHGWAFSVIRWRGVLEKILSEYSSPIVFNNAKFDIKGFRATGLPIPEESLINDAFLAHQILYPLRSHKLKSMAVQDIHPRADTGEHFLKESMKNRGWTWETIPEEALSYGLYSALDPVLSAREWEVLEPQLGSQHEAYEMELAYSLLCARMEYHGLHIDRSYLGRLREKWDNDLASIREELAGRGIDKPGSAVQIITNLEGDGWVPQVFTEKGTPVTDKYVMEALKMDYQTASLVLEFRYLSKRIVNYLTKMEKGADNTNHLHYDVRVMGARTGRSSIANPPLQQLTRAYEVRRCIIPDEGEKLFAVDFAAQELLLMLGISKEFKGIELLESGADFHKYIAGQTYGVPVEQIDKKDPRRTIAKNVTYGGLYGAGPDKVAHIAGVSPKDAEAVLAVLRREFPTMHTWKKDFTDMCEMMEIPSVRTIDRDIPLDKFRVFTQAVNTVIQATGAVVLKRAALRLDAAGYGGCLRVAVHDELVMGASDDEEFAEKAEDIRSIMEDQSFRPVLTTELSVSPGSWGDLYPKKEDDLD